MKIIKYLVAAIFLAGVYLFSVSFTVAQNQTSSATQSDLSQIKNKRRIFVDTQNERARQVIVALFNKDWRFEVVQNPEAAELIYKSGFDIGLRPVSSSLGRIIMPENEEGFPINQRSNLNRYERNTLAHLYNKRQTENWKKTYAVVYLKQNGENTPVWSKETLKISNSGAGSDLLASRQSGDELFLAKKFTKAVKKIK